MTRPTPGPRASGVAHVWCERIWPVLAGAVTAVGLLDVCHLIGLPALGLIVIGLWLFFAMVLYGAGSEIGIGPQTAVRIGLTTSVSIVTLLGVTNLFPAAGWFAALAVGVTSPALVHLLAPRVRRGLEILGRRTPVESVPDQAVVDRAFEGIVADLGKDDA